MRLYEFMRTSNIDTPALVSTLTPMFGLERVGGVNRTYEIDGQSAAIYVLKNSMRAIALVWDRANHVTHIYAWDVFNIFTSANWVLEIPMDANLDASESQIKDWIANTGSGTVSESRRKQRIMEARRTTPEEFIKLAQDFFKDTPEKLTRLSKLDLRDIAAKNDVLVPWDITNLPEYKAGRDIWNLSGKAAADSDGADVDSGISKELGAPVEEPGSDVDPAYNDMLALAKAKTASKLASTGKLYLMGRKANGAFFRVKGLDEYTAQLERLISREIAAQGGEDGRKNMEQQYEEMNSKVELIAGGRSNFIKSLLITGAPSSGKTYNVMQTIHKLGLKEHKDYVVKKGRISASSMYRTLIEQIDGMVIFDDCDSVVEDKNGVNMLKGALDTDPVRELSYDVKGTINVGAMEPERRTELVNAISRLFKGKPTNADIELLSLYVKKKKKSDDEDDDDFDFDGISAGPNAAKIQEMSAYFQQHLPNKIDFRGRVIFISNMQESEWDSAILTRAFTINMDFSSQEMLDFIDRIKGGIKAPNITEEEKQEVMDFLRDRYVTGKLKRTVNFRLVQQCFDLRLVSNWKSLVSQL